MTDRPGANARRGAKARPLLRLLLKSALGGAVLLLVAGTITVIYLSRTIASRFESELWSAPSKVYSSPLVVRPGGRVSQAGLRSRLERMGYRMSPEPPKNPGQYRAAGSAIELHTRDFDMPGGIIRGQAARINFGGGVVLSIQAVPSHQKLERLTVEPELLATLYGAEREDRMVLPLSAFPRYLVQAVIVAEDHRFFEHHGLDPFRILGAVWENVRNGGVVQGGSTITQQTVKNLFLGPERTMSRKLREALMAMILEARYPKERILEVYLNEIYLGQRGSSAVCGFGEAARFYFGKDGSDLSLSESALLVGLIPSPSFTNPFVHPERARARRDLVLREMLESGRIDEKSYRAALAETPRFASGSPGFRKAPHFVEFMHGQLLETYPEGTVTVGGLRVYTTLDSQLQSSAEDALQRGLAKLERERKSLRRAGKEQLQGAIVALRPATGEIVVLVGGRDFSHNQFDHAVQAHRQPGSLFKPFVYLAGFARSERDPSFAFTPATILDDSPFELISGGNVWRPENYDREFRGPVTVRQALEQSLNVPTVRAAQQVGVEDVVSVAKRCGIRSPLEPYPSLALGAQEVTPLEIATAYAVIANGGWQVQPSALLGVKDGAGKIVQRQLLPRRQVLSPEAAYLTLDLMRGVIDRGTAQAVRDAGMAGDFAGKTGTTNDKRDSWFVGIEPDLLTAVWVGFDDNSATGLTGASGALPIWIDFIRSSGLSPAGGTFPQPEGVVRVVIDPVSGQIATDGCPEAVSEVFIAGTEPQVECSEHSSGIGGWLRHLFRREPRHRI